MPFDDPNSEHLAKLEGENGEYDQGPGQEGHDAKGASLSKQVYKSYDIETEEIGGGKWGAKVEGEQLPIKASSNADAFKQAKEWIDELLSNEYDMSAKKLADGEPGQQPVDDITHAEVKGVEQGRLVGVVEHEGHSASIHATSQGHVVKGKGSAGYIKSEPITEKEHAEHFAKEMLKAHAKMSEREICAKMTNMGEVGGHAEQWASMSTKEKKEHWENLTGSATHKLSACMNMVEGHVDNHAAYCKSLADEVGYKPQ